MKNHGNQVRTFSRKIAFIACTAFSANLPSPSLATTSRTNLLACHQIETDLPNYKIELGEIFGEDKGIYFDVDVFVGKRLAISERHLKATVPSEHLRKLVMDGAVFTLNLPEEVGPTYYGELQTKELKRSFECNLVKKDHNSRQAGKVTEQFRGSLITGELTEFVARTNITAFTISSIEGSKDKYLSVLIAEKFQLTTKLVSRDGKLSGNLPLSYVESETGNISLLYDTKVFLVLNEQTLEASIELEFPDGLLIKSNITGVSQMSNVYNR
jgi:hypothetical protein